MTQLRANAVRHLAGEFVNRLRLYMAGSGGPDAAALADKLGRPFIEQVHEDACRHLGIDPKASNNHGHPWNRFGGARNEKARAEDPKPEKKSGLGRIFGGKEKDPA